jgi:hypothetical protein
LQLQLGGKGTQPHELRSTKCFRLAIEVSESSQQRCSFKGDGYIPSHSITKQISHY